MRRRWMLRLLGSVALGDWLAAAAGAEAKPDELIRRMSEEILQTIKADPALQADD